MRILMVCLGNICRSPIAEGVLRHKAQQKGLNWTVESAGVESYHVGEPPHRYSQKVCLSKGIDISGQRARRFSAKDMEGYDKIYAMSDDVLEEIQRVTGKNMDRSKVGLFLNELFEDSNASVPDPWYGGEEGYLPVYEMIDKACDAIIEKYS